MAIVKCKECSKDVSTKALACPNCGVKLPKRTSIVTWLVVIFLVVPAVLGVIGAVNAPSNSQESSGVAKAKTPEQTAEEKAKIERYARVQVAASQVKNILRDPDSLKWEAILANDDASVICMQYRAKNGFGGMNREQLTVFKDRFYKEAAIWNKNCAKKSLHDMTDAV